MKKLFNKMVKRPEIGETIESKNQNEDNEKKLFDKKTIFSTILIGLLGIIFLSNLSLVPLNGYKKKIEQKLKSFGFNMNIRGGASLNLFSLRYELKDVEIYSRENNNDTTKCHSSAQIVTPMIYVSFLTNEVTILDSHFIVSTNNNGSELYDFIKDKLSAANDLSLSLNNAQINLELCDLSGYAGTGQQDENSNKPDIKKELEQKIQNLSSKDQNKTFYSSDLMTIKKINLNISNKTQELIGAIIINKVLLNIKFTKTEHLTDIGLNSDYINFSLHSDNSISDKKGIIGSYKLSSDDFGRFISVIRGNNNDFLSNITNKMNIKINSDISVENNIISSVGNMITSYGNGEIKTVYDTSKTSKININFDELKTDNYKLITDLKENYNFLSIGDFLFQIIMRFNHTFDLGIKKITSDNISLGNISFGYNILDKNFNATSLSGIIKNGDIENGHFSLVPNAVAQKTDSIKMKINLDGKNFNNLLYLVQNVILTNSDTLNLKNSGLQQIGYNGYSEITFGLNGDLGISDFMINLTDNSSIGGSYMIMQPKDNNDYLFSNYQINLKTNGINLDNILNNSGQKKIWKYLAKIRNINNDQVLSEVGLLKNFINYTNYNAPFNIKLDINNTVLNGQPITGDVSFKNQNNLIEFNTNIKNSNLFVGSVLLSIDAKQVVPSLQFKVAFDSLNIKLFDQLLYGVYSTIVPTDATIYDYLKRGFYLPNMTNINTDINVEIKNIVGNVFNVNNFVAYFKGIGNTFNIDKISGDLTNGSFVFNGDLKNKKILDLNLSARISNLDLSMLLNSFIGKNDVASGKMFFDGNLVASGNSLYDIIFYSHGLINVKIQNMYWPYLDFASLSTTLIKSVHHGSLDINKILEGGKKMYFQNTSGDFVLEGGILTTNGIVAKAPGVSSVLKISVDMLNNELRTFDGNFLVLGKDPRAGKDYLSIPIAFKAAGKFDHLVAQLYVDRVQEYINSMNKLEVARDAA